MSRPVRLVLAGFSLGALLVGCVSRTPAKTPEERVADAEAKIAEMEYWSSGEATYAEYWQARRELSEARKDLAEQETNVAAGRQAVESAEGAVGAESYHPSYPAEPGMTYEHNY